jgi:GTPase
MAQEGAWGLLSKRRRFSSLQSCLKIMQWSFMKFIDSTEIFVASGKGGDGLVSFKTARNMPRLGPDGGDGGHGGDVVVVAAPQLNTLSNVRYRSRFVAKDGAKGGPNGRTGATGDDAEIHVPLGTELHDADSGRLICEILVPGQREIILEGGRRGFGNLRFVSSTHQAPEEYVAGQPGRELRLRLELKLLADVGLAGLPNAGKSTLLSVLSAATPKIADYPFTTLEPQLGVVEFKDRGEFDIKSFVIADIPGLIEGASEGRGLGHEFLKHLERTKIIAYVLDLFPLDDVDPITTFKLIRSELFAYGEKLAAKKSIVILNKADLADGLINGSVQLETINREIKAMGYPVFIVSAAAKTGLDSLKIHLHEMVKQERLRFDAELASRLPVVKGLRSAASLGITGESLLDFSKAMSEGRVFSQSAKHA